MTTAAAIDRLVHHSVILEMTGTSVRADAAEQAEEGGSNDDSYRAGDDESQAVCEHEVDGEV